MAPSAVRAMRACSRGASRASVSWTRVRSISSDFGLITRDAALDNGADVDVIVVGNGPLGSAIARHIASEHRDKSVVVLDSETLTSGSNDLGRIVRPLDAEGRDDWTALNCDSIEAFESMERESGIVFFDPRGSMFLGSETFVERGASRLRARGVPHERASGGGSEFVKTWPFLSAEGIPETYHAAWDSVGGYVNPHKMRAAQNMLMRKENANARVTSGTCVRVQSKGDGESERTRVWMSDGNTYTCGLCVMACGAYTEALARESGLLSTLDASTGVGLGGIKISRRTVVLAEVLESEVNTALASMPTIKYEVPQEVLDRARVKSATGTSDQSRNEAKSVYVLPPIYYPGPNPSPGWYVKIGGGPQDFMDKSGEQSWIRTERELEEWMSSEGDEDVADQLHDILLHMFPKTNFQCLIPKACATTTTDDGTLVIETLGSGSDVVAVSACQGKAAGPADAIGRRVAATCATLLVPS